MLNRNPNDPVQDLYKTLEELVWSKYKTRYVKITLAEA